MAGTAYLGRFNAHDKKMAHGDLQYERTVLDDNTEIHTPTNRLFSIVIQRGVHEFFINIGPNRGFHFPFTGTETPMPDFPAARKWAMRQAKLMLHDAMAEIPDDSIQ